MNPYNLFQEMDMRRREIDRALRGLGTANLYQSFLPGLGTGDFPRINLSEDENNYYLEALVPGVSPDDLELNLMQETLTLSGERQVSEDDNRTWHRKERGAGRFMRSIELPDEIDSEQMEATYTNGVLLVTMAKPQKKKAKRISVKAQ